MVHGLFVVRTFLATGLPDASALRSSVLETSVLHTPGVPCIVPAGVFDAFGWCPATTLEWARAPGFLLSGEVTAHNPPGMLFVLRQPCEFLPKELARLHVPAAGLEREWALAPYGIDAATDELYARRVPPGSLLWLVASDLPGLVWGLHDWAHFHNHGPFERRAWTELQCDATALAWLWINRRAVGIGEMAWDSVRASLGEVSEQRFADEGEAFDGEWLSKNRVVAMAEEASAIAS
jgi:hypothetical protein